MASRIRIGLVGLSKSSTGISWASTAHLPYLHSPRGQAKYEIVAVCNSSIESARKAVIDFDLSPNTETYGDAAQLATNPNIDLVVCNVRVDRHHKIIRPSVEAGKAVFCEWPLAHDIDHVQDLVKLAHDKGGRTMIGLQGRFSPLILKVKDLLEQGRIGKVLSSDARVSGMTDDRAVFYSSMDYFTQREVGGNMVTIGIGHLLDPIQFAIGEILSVKSTLQLQRPSVAIVNPRTKEVLDRVTSDVPDLVVTTGTLDASTVAQQGATFSLRYRRGAPFPGESPLVWTVHGEKGEIRIASPGFALHVAHPEPIAIEVHDFETDTVDTVTWDAPDWMKELPHMSQYTACLYEAFAKEEKTPKFGDALRRHGQLEAIMADWAH